MANMSELEATLGYIEAHPEEWDQKNWFCETAACFAGITVIRHGWQPVNWYHLPSGKVTSEIHRDGEEGYASVVASQILDLTHNQACALFVCDNTLDDLKQAIKAIGNGELE
jgi:hypothetical protein